MKVLYTLGSLVLIVNMEIRPRVSFGRLEYVKNYKTVSPKSGSGRPLEVVVFCLE